MLLTAAIVLLSIICLLATLALYASAAVDRTALSPELEETSVDWEIAPNGERVRNGETIPVHNA